MRAVLADTGPLFAAADEDDSDHEKAVRQTDELDRHGLIVVVPYPILLEAYSLVLKRFGSNAALRWLGNAVDASLINPHQRITRSLAPLCERCLIRTSA